MKLVLDTNIFCADYQLQGNAFRILFEVASRIGVEILVPQIVFDETVGKFKSDFQENSLKLEKAIKSIERLLGEKLQIANHKEFDEIAKDYESYLVKRLEDNGIKMLPYPQIEHKIIASRAIMRKKPFKENGDGYRDTLIWFCLLELTKKSEYPVVFVTANTSDFGKGSLLPDLQNDLIEMKIPQVAINIVTTLDEFNNSFITPALQTLEDVVKQIENNRIDGFSLKNWVQNSLLEDLAGLESVFVGIDQDHSEMNFTENVEVKSIVVDDVKLLPSGNLVVSATTEISIVVEINTAWEQYKNYDDVRDFWGEIDFEPFTLESIETGENAEVGFTLILKGNTYEVLSSEIDEVKSTWDIKINSHAKRPHKA